MALQLLIIVVFCLLLYIIYSKLHKIYQFWESRDVRGPKPLLLLGNLWPVMTKTKNFVSLASDAYERYPDEKFVGLYLGLNPTLVLRNVELMKTILIKDFASFVDRGFVVSNHSLGKHIFSEEGENWRIIRKRLTPLFTIGKLKRMVPLLDACAVQYLRYLERETKEPQEMKKLNDKYTLKCITTVAFGLDIDAFVDDKSEFVEKADEIFQYSPRKLLFTIMDEISPTITKKLDINQLKPGIADFFFSLVSGIVKERAKEPLVRGDFMDILIEMKNQGKVGRTNDEGVEVEIEVTDAFITAQALLFYVAGFETTAAAITFVLYELARNPDIQKRCHEEVDRVLAQYEDQLPYEAFKGMQYLEMVLDETLRKHPTVSIIRRRSVANYTFPGTSLHVPPGTKVLIPILALHHDERYFPNPEEFDPERFSPQRRGDIKDGTYLPFGVGPRNCIGLRLARQMALLGLTRILSRFRFDTCARTVQHVRADPAKNILNAVGGIWLKISRR